MEGNYPHNFRIIDRYRWNKGHVYVYDKNLVLHTDKFFGREDYKDMTEETAKIDSPFNKSENLLGLEPVFYHDSLCYFFSRHKRMIYIYHYDISKITPEFKLISSQKIMDVGEIDNYKFKLCDNGEVIFHYAMNNNDKRVNYFYWVDLTQKSTEVNGALFGKEDDKFAYFVSDFNCDRMSSNLIVSGTYSDYSNLILKSGKTLLSREASYFAFVFQIENHEIIKTLYGYSDATFGTGIEKNRLGYKTLDIVVDKMQVFITFEKIKIDEKNATVSGGKELAGSYFTSTSLEIILMTIDLESNEVNEKYINLKYDISSEKEFIDKHWRTFHTSKGQGIHTLIFNGKTIVGYNETSIVHMDYTNKKTIYADRNNNYYRCDWSGEGLVYDLLEINNKNIKCYFFDGYYVRYTILDYGYKLEKVTY
jgi:hypothetical protein